MKKEKTISPSVAMKLAIQSAKKGIGFVEPNPPVGCVILNKNYQLLSVGYHKMYGGNHAEVEALKKVKNKKLLKGAHVFVTLEPCHHQGQTPPCSHALAKYPIATLTYGAKDPFTRQKGFNYLKQKKDIKIIHSRYHKKELEELVSAFKFSIVHKRPFVSLKVASSMDGNIALKKGESQWITEEKARRHAHFLRAQHSAVLIGVNTLLQDNPRLNIREKCFKNKKNKVVILDPKGESVSFLSKSRLLKVHSAKNIIICCGKNIKLSAKYLKQIRKKGVKVYFFPVKGVNNRKSIKVQANIFNLNTVLKSLYQQERIQSVLVEGGAFTISEFLKQKLAQRIFLYIAPCILGDGLKWSEHLTVPNLNQRVSLKDIKWHNLNRDFFLEANLLY